MKKQMICPICKRKKLDPKGEQAHRIVTDFVVKTMAIKYKGMPVDEEDLMEDVDKMMLTHEYCFMFNDDCKIKAELDKEMEDTLKRLVDNGEVSIDPVTQNINLTKEGREKYEQMLKNHEFDDIT